METLQHMLAERKSQPTERLSGKFFFESWIIDTGASHHMTGTLEFLLDIHDMAPVLIKLPDGRFTTANKHGRVLLGSSLSLQDVFYVDGLHCHLISVSQLTRDSGCMFQITDKVCVIQDRITKTLIGAGEQQNGLYFFRGLEAAAAIQHKNSSSIDVWHRRLGHPSSKALEMLKFSDFSSCKFDSKQCEICISAKQTRDSFPLSFNKTSFAFELIHCDLWGPYRSSALCGSRYFLTILDDYSRAVWIYLLPSKQEAPKHLKNFLALVERQFSSQVKMIRSDNGSEFICLSDFFAQQGIQHETSCVGTPQQNGRVERKHRHILNVARALRFQANLPIEFWGYCALTAGYLINRTPTPLLKGKTPFEMIYNRPPPMDHLRVFGCLCHVHNQKHGGDKFASRSVKSIFIGYPLGKKGWRVYNMETGAISVSHDVVFNESQFPYDSTANSSSPSPSLTLLDDVPNSAPDETDLLSSLPPGNNLSQTITTTETNAASSPIETSATAPEKSVTTTPATSSSDSETEEHPMTDHDPSENTVTTDLEDVSNSSNANDVAETSEPETRIWLSKKGSSGSIGRLCHCTPSRSASVCNTLSYR